MNRLCISFAILTLNFGCCGCAQRNQAATMEAPSLMAVYRTGQDREGYDTVNCYIANVGTRPVYISDRILCSWNLEPRAGKDDVAADGAFWSFSSSPVPSLYCLVPIRRDLLRQGIIPDAGLPMSGRISLENTKVKIGLSRLTLTIHLVVHRELNSELQTIDVDAISFK